MGLELDQIATPEPKDNSFEAVYAELASGLSRTLRNRNLTPSQVEEASQETWLRFYLKFYVKGDSLPTNEGGIRAYLYRIASNLAVDTLRHQQAIRMEPLEEAVGRGTRGDGVWVDANQQPDPEKEVLRVEKNQAVRAALRRLPARYRQALELRHDQDLSCEEIALRMQASPGAIRTTLCRARQTFKPQFEGLYPEAA